MSGTKKLNAEIIGKLEDVLKEHMPSVAGGLVLTEIEKNKGYLEDIAILKRDKLSLEKVLTEKNNMLSDLTIKVEGYEDMDAMQKNIEEGIEYYKELKLQQENFELKIRLEYQSSLVNSLEQYTALVCGNLPSTVIRDVSKSITDNSSANNPEGFPHV